MTDEQTPRWLRRAVLAGLLGGLLWVGFVVIRPFMVAIAWAAILTCVSWPLHLRLLARLRGHRWAAAFAMTVMLTLALGVSLLWLGLLLRSEGVAAVREATALLHAGVRLPERIVSIPWLGPWLQEWLLELGGDRAAWGRQLSEWVRQWGGNAMRIVGDLGLNSLRLGIALLTVFFLFRDGDHLLDELRGVLRGLLGDRVQAYFTVIGDTTRAGVYGLLLAAFAQGLLAGLGYWVAGVNAPAFWGAATAVVAVIPFGAPLVWGSIGVWLLLQGQVGAGIGLLLWGTLAISWIDNLVRPLIISGVAKIPFLLVLYGVLGGLAAFGLIGLFVGPVILAILLALWREWTANNADPNVCPAP
ncbi:MAG TPA: AI-2E family transporter [Burkholderiaceae bacterium]